MNLSYMDLSFARRLSEKAMESRPCLFLDLPSHVRQRIYIHADLVRFCPINMAEEHAQHEAREDWSSSSSSSDSEELCIYIKNCTYRVKRLASRFSVRAIGIPYDNECCICPPLPVQLLRVCRQMYEETFPMLYSRNKFVVNPSDLTAFNLLGRDALSELRSLHVRLTSCSCVTGHFCLPNMECDRCHPACLHDSEPALSVLQEDHQKLFERWRGLCDVLSSSCSSLSRLSVVGDCEDLQAAYQVTKPLQGRLKLESCSIRLGQSPDHELRQLAESTARSLVPGGPTSFPFGRLPPELQELVLAYTDLVSPLYLAWKQESWAGPPRNFLRQFEDHHFICCMRCTDAGKVCACPVFHAAYTTNACSCWCFPSSIFLVNRKVNELAKRVFFSKNKFVLSDVIVQRQLLRLLPATSLAHLRWLRLVFPSFRRTDGLSGSPGLEGWGKMASVVKEVAQISHLTIELDLAYGVRRNPEILEEWTTTASYSKALTWTSYQKMAELFIVTADTKTAPYRDFFVRLASPQPKTFEDDLLRWQREQELEKRIMGPDYDSATRGKYKRPMGFYEKVVMYQEPVYGPDGMRLNPVSERVKNGYDPDESMGPLRFEYSWDGKVESAIAGGA